MHKNGNLLNSQLAGVITAMGHTDKLVIADAGLPIPPGVEVLDLALVPGVPAFALVVLIVMQHLKVESAIIAEELMTANQAVYQDLMQEIRGLKIRRVPHEQLKLQTRDARLIVRTGECTPYANVILVAGVTF
jgi:D-ribose pyranase